MYKYQLNDVKWGNFFVKEIFEIEKCKCSKVSSLTEGKIPYVGATNRNNGVLSFIDGEDKLITKGNCIAFICDGEGSIGYSMYKEEDFIGSTTVKVGRNKRLNKYNAKFISTIADTVRSKYNFGFKRNEEHLKKEILQLPIDDNNNPDWHFMEEYIKERENKQRNDLKEYYKSRLLDLVICPEILTDVEWGEFSLRDLFVFERGNQNNMSVCEAGDIPLISAKKIDNGVKAFISDNGKKLFEGHILTLNNDGDGGVGIAYYQANKMALDTHVTALIPIIPINRSSLLFISKTITIQRDKFSHGYSLNNNRMKAQKIVLPIDKKGNPNWSYMENFIKNIEQKQIKNVLKYLDKYIYIYIMYNHFDKVDWKEFFLSDICNINSGVRLTKANMEDGNIPFIGATDSNNGITNFVSNTNASFDKNVLGVNYNGSVVENFYHPYSCVFSDDVKRLSFKDEQGQNKYCYMFLKQMILQQKEKYRYAYKFNGDRMARQKIMMPVDENNAINYVMIEKFIRVKEMNIIVNIIENLGGYNYE